MLPVETEYGHVLLNEEGIPVIAGSTIKVVEIVLDKIAYGWSPEELHFQHPQLTMGQIYSALAYYADYPERIEQDIERRLERVDQLQHALGRPPLVAKLQARGLI